MKAIQVDQRRDGPSDWRERELAWADAPAPDVGPGEIRIRVRATAVNRADLLQVVGHYPPPRGASDIPGMEAGGEVEAVGEGVTRFAVGDRVCALLAGGGYAELVVCRADHALPIPEGMSFEGAAALPEVLTTAYLNLYLEAGLSPGERVLVHAGASGVGTATIQLAKANDNPCYATTRDDRKAVRCIELGATASVNARAAAGFAEIVREWTGKRGVDVILDAVGGGYLEENLRCLAPRGRLVLIGNMSGQRGSFDLNRFFVKRQRIVGSVLRSRSDAEKAGILASLAEHAWPHVVAGTVVPVIDRVVDITSLAEAFDAIETNQTFGKVVLRIP